MYSSQARSTSAGDQKSRRPGWNSTSLDRRSVTSTAGSSTRERAASQARAAASHPRVSALAEFRSNIVWTGRAARVRWRQIVPTAALSQSGCRGGADRPPARRPTAGAARPGRRRALTGALVRARGSPDGPGWRQLPAPRSTGWKWFLSTHLPTFMPSTSPWTVDVRKCMPPAMRASWTLLAEVVGRVEVVRGSRDVAGPVERQLLRAEDLLQRLRPPPGSPQNGRPGTPGGWASARRASRTDPRRWPRCRRCPRA